MTKACIFNIQKFSIHDGPGIRTVVFFKGCPLRCFWCANPESQSGLPENMWDHQKKELTTVGEYQTLAEIIEEVMKDQVFYEESNGGVTLSGGEVLYQADFAIQLLKELKALQIHTASETTGYASPTKFADFIDYLDIVYFDVKHYDSQAHQAGTGVRNELILRNLQYAIQHHPNVVVRIPIIPDFNDSLADAQHFAALFTEMGIKEVELLPFHQFGEKKYDYLDRAYVLKDIPQLHTEDLQEHQRLFERAGIQCSVQ